MATVRRITQHNPPASRYDITCPVRIYDAPGNRFRGYRYADPVNGNVTKYIVEKVAPNGTFLAAWEVTPRDNLKIGVNSATMCDMGSGIVVELWVYNPNAALPRQWLSDDVLIADAGFERGNRLQERGGEGAVGNTGGGEVEMDWVEFQTRIDAAVNNTVSRIVANFGGANIRDGIEQKAMDAFGKAFDPELYDSNPRSRYAQDKAAPWFRDRAFEAAEAAEDND